MIRRARKYVEYVRPGQSVQGACTRAGNRGGGDVVLVPTAAASTFGDTADLAGITVPAGVTIYGTRSCILTVTAGTVTMGTNSRLENVRVVGGSVGVTVTGNYVTLQDCNIAGTTAVTVNASQCRLLGCTITGGGSGTGVDCSGASAGLLTIRDCVIDAGLYGVFGDGAVVCPGLRLVDTYIATARYGVTLQNTSGSTVVLRSLVRGCNISYTTSNASPGVGVRVGHTGAGANLFCEIDGNHIAVGSGSGTAGIGVNVTGSASVNSTRIESNRIECASQSRGIVCDRLAQASTIALNRVYDAVTNSIVTTNTTGANSACFGNHRQTATAIALDGGMSTVATNL